jgi:UDP-N-acetylmuramate-alanine ligase
MRVQPFGARAVVDRGFDGSRPIARNQTGSVASDEPARPRALMNALAATAVGDHFGVPLEDIAARLSAAQPVPRRGAQHMPRTAFA